MVSECIKSLAIQSVSHNVFLSDLNPLGRIRERREPEGPEEREGRERERERATVSRQRQEGRKGPKGAARSALGGRERE